MVCLVPHEAQRALPRRKHSTEALAGGEHPLRENSRRLGGDFLLQAGSCPPTALKQPPPPGNWQEEGGAGASTGVSSEPCVFRTFSYFLKLSYSRADFLGGRTVL